jgi:signal transduction histidine kinase/ligand-binding sensor domain-containing protein
MICATLGAEAQLSKPMAFDTYQVKDGMAGNWVQDLVQDRDGNMWIGTNEGLSKYDGYSFRNYRSDALDSTSLSSDHIRGLALDSSGNVWARTQFGLDLYNPTRDNFQRFPYSKFTENLRYKGAVDRSQAIFCASDGSIYARTPEGMVVFNLAKDEYQYHEPDSGRTNGLRSSKVKDFAETSDGRIFVAGEAGIDIFDPKTKGWSPFGDEYSLPSDIIKLCITNDQVLWIADDRENDLLPNLSELSVHDSISADVRTIDLKTGKKHDYKYLPKTRIELLGEVSEIIEDSDGNIWITRFSGGTNNLYRHISETNTFQSYGYEVNNPASIAWNYSTALVQDRNKDIWVGTSRGLSKSNGFKSQFSSFSWVPGQPFDFGNLIYRPTEIAPDQFLVVSDGTQQGTIWNKNTGKSKVLSLEYSLGLFEYDSVYTRSIWTQDINAHLRQIEVPAFTSVDYNNTVAADGWYVFSVLPLNRDSLLLSSNEGIWYFSISSQKFERLSLNGPNHNSNDEFVFSTLPLKENTYISIQRAGQENDNNAGNAVIKLVTFDVKSGNILKTYVHNLSNGNATLGATPVFFKDSKNRIWMGGTNRMVSFDPATEQFREYPGEIAYNGRQVVSAFEDFDGQIWFNSTEQVSRLNPESAEIQSINKSDGLITFRLNPLSSILTRKGEVIFAGVGGVTYFDPRTFKTPTDLPNIVISAFLSGEDKIDVKRWQISDKPIEIAADKRSVDIEYKSIAFRNAAFTTYRYILEGWQKDWQDAGTRRFVQYTNLPPGTYTFKVVAINTNGLESAAPAEIAFKILPPWWRTWWAYGAYALAFALLLFAADRAMRRRIALRQKEKNRQKELAQAKEIEKAYHNLEMAHGELKAAQEQLIQQEKLASLGQLTAGIAHEIKNPLNFVNNFTELNIEMVDEAMVELTDVPKEKADPIRELLIDVKANLQKILQHGTRADGIVKSMLQHSRGGSGKMEPTDLNALLREYINLAFHGMRASKNPIDVKLEFELDDSLGMVNLMGEDFSRVVLNLANNAFDAMREKAKTDPSYHPVLKVQSKRNGDKVIFSITDNGPGIPEAIKDKILQPFFTTKKGTDGTGLGLSITHDIIKAHGGTVDIQSKPGQTVFEIIL